MTIGDAKLVGGPRPRSPLEASEDYLRSAQPRLILWSENDGGPRFKITSSSMKTTTTGRSSAKVMTAITVHSDVRSTGAS
jgi:hypothetical protein